MDEMKKMLEQRNPFIVKQSRLLVKPRLRYFCPGRKTKQFCLWGGTSIVVVMFGACKTRPPRALPESQSTSSMPVEQETESKSDGELSTTSDGGTSSKSSPGSDSDPEPEKSNEKSPENGDDKDKSGEDDPQGSSEPGPMLDNLPKQELERVVHGVFTSAHECEFCHTASVDVLQNKSVESVSPNRLWQSSMMAFSARDPYWLAQFSHELQVNPNAEDLISDKCTRCHAPVANESMRLVGKKIGFDTVIKDESSIGKLGREGVTCSLCHQISGLNQGRPESYTGNYVVGTEREIWGPHKEPFPNPMRMRLNYFVKESAHVMESAYCASCHTVFTNPLDSAGKPESTKFAEQVPFLEWKNSEYSKQGKTCQSCHVPRRGRDGHEFTTVLSNRPGWLDTQREVGDHGFVGGNAYMLELLANEREWAGISTDKAEILDTAERSEKFLKTAVIMELSRGKTKDILEVKLSNNAGHRFPTAYPSRRAWIEVIAQDKSGSTVFHSGGFDSRGRIKNAKLPMKHYVKIDTSNQVQIYEGVMADKNNRPTHTLLAAHQWWKDNRLLPKGWREDHGDARWTKPKGVEADEDFVAGSDTIEYGLPDTSVRAIVKLWFQTVPPESVEALSRQPTPASRRFRVLTQKHPTLPKLVVTKEIDL